jgi:hypothetical protein
MKLLVVVSSLDLTQPFSATPAWWQLLKGLAEIGVDVLAAPYQGPAIETLWWRAEANPAKLQGDTFRRTRDAARKVGPKRRDSEAPADEPDDTDHAESRTERATRTAARYLVAPLWGRNLDRILTREPDIDAVLFLTVPLNQLTGIPAEIQRKHGKPVFYYDGDVPASLPSQRGFQSGFRIYQGADPAEYTAFFSNSRGGSELIQALGARAVHTLYYGVDPDVFAPLPLAQDFDVFFYGHGREYRGEWIDALLRDSSQALPEARFAARGKSLGDIGRTELLPYLSFSKLREYACRSRVNLVITRAAHAGVFASSTSRPFELAALGATMLASPYLGVEEWFEPGKEILMLSSPDEAVERLRWLLAHDAERRAIGEAARRRALAEHTFRHRAQELVRIIQSYR